MKVRQGSLTIFMTLILSLLVTLTCTALLAVRMAAARTQILCGMDIGLYSLFAGYDRELLKEYDLFFLDGSYGNGEIQDWKLCDTFRQYMEPVLLQNYQNLILTGEGLTGYTLATDGNGTLVHEQAVEYMKKNLGISGLQLLMEKLGNRSEDSQKAENLWNSTGGGGNLENYDKEMVRASQASSEASKEAGEERAELPEGEFGDDLAGGGYHETVVNPIPVIQELWRQGVLGLVLPGNREISGKKLARGQVLSERSRNQGSGWSASGVATGLNSRILFHEYVLEKMGDYSEPSGKELDYETEYILYGHRSDEENLHAVANRLLLIREGLNLGYLLSDSVKNAEADAMALAIASGFLVPPAAGIVKGALMLCWSFAESILDLQTLFRGGKVPAVKTAENWQLSLGNLATFIQNTDAFRRNDTRGLSYTDYLRILMLTGEEAKLCIRTMDCMEMGMRAKGRAGFRLDTCIGEAGIWAEVLANGRKRFSVDRVYSY